MFPYWSDAVELTEAFGRLLDHVEHGLTEGTDQLLGVVGADALDHAAAQVPLDPFQVGRRRDLLERSAELQAVFTVIVPPTLRVDEFVRLVHGGQAHHGDRLVQTLGLNAQDAETAVGIVKCHALDQPSQWFAIFFVVLRHDGAGKSGTRLPDSMISGRAERKPCFR